MEEEPSIFPLQLQQQTQNENDLDLLDEGHGEEQVELLEGLGQEPGDHEEDRHRQGLKHKAVDDDEDEDIAEEGADRKKRICIRDCSVILERLMFKEVMVTAPSPEKREVYYVSTYDDESEPESDLDSFSSCSDDRYEDWRLQMVDALDYRNLKKKRKNKIKQEILSSSSSSTTSSDNDKSENEPILKLYMRFPSDQENFFCVDYAKGDLHSILNILSGEGLAAPILDAYLLLRLEQYWRKAAEPEPESSIQKIKREYKTDYELRRHEDITGGGGDEVYEYQAKPKKTSKSITNYQYLSYNFMPVKDRDQPVSTFKVNMRFFPKLEKDVLHSCQLIAPQFTSKHFYLAVFDFPNECVRIHDSSWHYLPIPLRIHQLKTILRALVGEEDSIRWKFDIVKRSSPQYDEYSCGIYTIYYADTLLKGVHIQRNCRKLPTQTVKQIRKRVVKQLLNTTSVGRKFLEAITFS